MKIPINSISKISIRPAEISLPLVSLGVTASTVLGSMLIYYISILSGAVLALISLSINGKIISRPHFLILAMALWIFVSIFFRTATGQFGLFSSPLEEVIKAGAIYIVLLMVIMVSYMPASRFERCLAIVALAHSGILAYGLASGDAVVRILDGPGNIQRFEGLGFPTAAWAEISLGTLMASILSRSLFVQVLTVPIALYGMLAADMRTTIVSAAAILILVITSNAFKINIGGSKVFTVTLIILSILLLIITYSDDMLFYISRILLLNDPHRGVASGFSNRFENIYNGWASFEDNMIFGSGFVNPVVNYTHNGYILTLAQMGIILGSTLFFFLFKSLYNSYYRKEYILLFVVVGLLLFYMGQPRNINFQLSPLVGLFAVGRALIGRNRRDT